MNSYPPEPWTLSGHGLISVFLVRPPRSVPELPQGFRPVRLGGRLVVGAAWFVYDDGGMLAYHELMTTVLVRRGLRIMPTITDIWVDSGPSCEGGRALWSIPKEMADFANDPPRAYALGRAGQPIAAAALGTVRRLPGRWPVRFRVAQRGATGAQISPVRSRAALEWVRLDWTVPNDGPLAAVSGRRPVFSFGLRALRMTFGSDPRSAPARLVNDAGTG